MNKITVINAYGDKNVGDAAILQVGLNLIHAAFKKDYKVSVLCESTKGLSDFINLSKNISIFQNPYGYAISGSAKASYLTKITRFVFIYFYTFLRIFLNIHLSIELPKKGFYSYINQIKEASLVVGMGGGYFITQSRIKDYFGLMLSLISIYVAKQYNKRVVFYPLSFGPFASKIQEDLTYKAITNTTVMARDKITLKKIVSIDKKRLIKVGYYPDLGLFYNPLEKSSKTKNEKKYIVLTAREWFLDKIKQNNYEKSLIDFIESVYNKYGLRTVFIPMAKNSIEDDDNRLALRIKTQLNNKSIFSIYKFKNVKDVQVVLRNARISVCTRMHSAILSTTVGTPFIAIGYGNKTLGFMKSLGLERWLVDISEVSLNVLLNMFERLHTQINYNQFNKIVDKKRQEILKYQTMIINTILLK